ncbi:hypothetical protein DQ384_36490 [Sphaerisporangium album]|uniref:Uncharacterized protein n=1 Tax=Sphaerisporangium album TaxID=509200 RepID=A0A367EUP0_9ACTN|nr:hypothetical protein [Sphaerisporangium album]RCG21117.1 hypothetical protein DQ384_36490 [Sphaerisporangium album]
MSKEDWRFDIGDPLVDRVAQDGDRPVSGRDQLTPERAAYVVRVRQVLRDPGHAEAIAPWLTRACTECEEQSSAADPHSVVGDGWVLVPCGEHWSHVMVDGWVVIGCEGYRIVSPVALGLGPASEWEDWRTYGTRQVL